jgi:hypothetical protein
MEYETYVTIGVGVQGSVRLWYKKNGIIEKSRPKYEPLEWTVRDQLESTRMIKWFIIVGNKRNNREIQMDEIPCTYLENLSVSSA